MPDPVYMIPASAETLAAIRSAVCKGASTSLRKPNSMFVLTALLDQALADGPVEVKAPETHPVFTLDCFNREQMTDEDVADALEGLAQMIREGFTSGDANGLGWWSVTNLTDADDMPEDED